MNQQMEKAGVRRLIAIAPILGVLFLASCDSDSGDWERAVEQNTAVSYEAYLTDHLDGQYRVEAEDAIRRLEEPGDWKAATVGHSLSSYRTYLDKHPAGKNSETATFYYDMAKDVQAITKRAFRSTPVADNDRLSEITEIPAILSRKGDSEAVRFSFLSSVEIGSMRLSPSANIGFEPFSSLAGANGDFQGGQPVTIFVFVYEGAFGRSDFSIVGIRSRK